MKTLFLLISTSANLLIGTSAFAQANQPGSGNCLSFDNNDQMVVPDAFPSVTDNFTMELWTNPVATRNITSESNWGISGTCCQRYAIYPRHGGCGPCNCVPTDAGAGISVGTNGISVFEHAGCYMPSPLVYNTTLSGWNHIAIVYINKQPRLYLNGELIKTGLTSTKIVHPSASTNAYLPYGPYSGQIDEIRIWDYARSQTQIRENMCKKLTGNEPGLVGYWRFDEGSGSTAFDSSPIGNNGTLQ